jgi:adenylate cyclase
MTPCAAASLATWISQAGLAVADETKFLGEFCARATNAGLLLSHAIVFVDTLHPIYEGRVLRWEAQAGAVMALDYEPTEGERLEQWERSPFYRLLETGDTLLRLPIHAGSVRPFRLPSDLLDSGATEYIACITRFSPDGVIGGLDCVYSGWATRAAGGFAEEQLAAIEGLLPPLAMVLKSCALTRIAQTLVETYLGRDAGRRVLGGRIARGAVERISTALWFSDLRDFTRIAEAAAPDQLIPFLGEHAETVIEAIHVAGGDVLKLIGDGTLAIFTASDPAEACHAALAAAERAIAAIAALGRRRASSGLAATTLYLGFAFRRRLLRQYRQSRAPRLHSGRARRKRGEPDRCDVPLARPAGTNFIAFCLRARRRCQTAGLGRPLCASWCWRRAAPVHIRARRTV